MWKGKVLCFCFPPTDADLLLLIIAEDTAHDPGHGPTHHVCLNTVSIIRLQGLEHFLCNSIYSKYTYCHTYLLIVLKFFLTIQVQPLISYPVVFSKVTTEQWETSPRQIHHFCVDTSPKCYFKWNLCTLQELWICLFVECLIKHILGGIVKEKSHVKNWNGKKQFLPAAKLIKIVN